MVCHYRSIIVFVLSIIGVCVPAMASSIFTVDADLNSITDYYADNQVIPNYHPSLVDTGIFLSIGDILSVDSTGIWRISPSDPWTDANGQIGRDSGGFFAGSLLGQISTDGPHMVTPGNPQTFFFIGSSYSGIVTQAGFLYLGFNDTDYGNNEGYVTATVDVSTPAAPVPEPSTILVLGIGFAGVALRKKFLGN